MLYDLQVVQVSVVVSEEAIYFVTDYGLWSIDVEVVAYDLETIY